MRFILAWIWSHFGVVRGARAKRSKLIWEAVKARVSLFVDGRMSAEVIRVLAAGDEVSRQHYPTTLFTQAIIYRQLHRQEHHLHRQ